MAESNFERLLNDWHLELCTIFEAHEAIYSLLPDDAALMALCHCVQKRFRSYFAVWKLDIVV